MKWQMKSHNMESQHRDNSESSKNSGLLHLWGKIMSPNERRREKSKRKAIIWQLLKLLRSFMRSEEMREQELQRWKTTKRKVMEDKEEHISREAINNSKKLKRLKNQFRCSIVPQRKSFEEWSVWRAEEGREGSGFLSDVLSQGSS